MIAGPRTSNTGAWQTRIPLVLMVASGFAALGYQIVWTQQSALWLGHEAAAVFAVVAAFFGGLAAGALLLGPRIDRSARPGRWYAACEAVIGLWGVALAFLLPPATGWLLDLIGVQPTPAWHWSVAFFGTFVLLLPATAAMGGTLPAMERVLAAYRDRGAPIAILYAGNTFGAVLGVLAAAFWLVPQFGLTLTAAVCALLNLLCAVAATRLFSAPVRTATPVRHAGAARALGLLAATGALGIGYEVLVVRVLSQVAENTVYTFALLLTVYLVGTTLGAAAYARWLSSRAPERLRDALLRALAAACLLGTLSLTGSVDIKAVVLQTLGGSMAAALAGETALALVAFLMPTIVMGALFSHLATRARSAGIDFGRALGVNTLGAALAPLLFGVLLVPLLGPKLSLLLVAAGYLALSTRQAWTAPGQWFAFAAAVALAVWIPSLAIVDVPPGGQLVSYAEGTLATVSVVEDANGVSTLHINNRQQEGSSATRVADARQGLLPVLLHPDPRRALFLGVGTGVTAWSALQDPLLQVDAVDLLPEVVEASAHFTRTLEAETAGRRPTVMTADARRFVRAGGTRYDVIVSDNFHPARSGSGSLYTLEHFRAVRDGLAEDGLFCQWLPLHQLDLDTLRSIVRTFLEVYPDGWAMLATNSLDTPVIGLVGRKDDARLNLDQVRRRLAEAEVAGPAAALGLDSELALLGSFAAGPRALARFAGDAPVNTDDHPVVTYAAPRITYAPDSRPRDRLIALLQEVSIAPDELLTEPADPALAPRLAAYWKARNRFIVAGRDVSPSADVQQMLAQVREPLLSVVRISADFRPAYDPLLRMAGALGRTDAEAARALLLALHEAQPSRPEAEQALRALQRTGR